MCFAILGLRPGASADQVKAAYRELAKLHHPDVGGNAVIFRRVKAAYDRAMRLASKATA